MPSEHRKTGGGFDLKRSDFELLLSIVEGLNFSLFKLTLHSPFSLPAASQDFFPTMFNTTLNPTIDPTMNFTTPAGPRGTPPWFQFPVCAVAPYGFVFYFGVKVFNLAVGTPCNVLVIWQIATRKSDSSTSDIFIFNLAILDAYFCLMTPIEMTNRLLLDDSQIWYSQRFAYGIKDVAPLFLVSLIYLLSLHQKSEI